MVLALGLCAGCQTTSSHQFAAPSPDWKVRTGQLAYTSPKVSLIGEVLVRYSNAGEFELTFSKGPGVMLLRLRQDAQFASAEGPLARGRWSGSTASAPAHLRGWFALREKVLRGGNSMRVNDAGQTFRLRF
jgi:hypothetical protein